MGNKNSSEDLETRDGSPEDLVQYRPNVEEILEEEEETIEEIVPQLAVSGSTTRNSRGPSPGQYTDANDYTGVGLNGAPMNMLTDCFRSLPLKKSDMKEKITDKVTRQIVMRQYGAGQDILLKGSKSEGIFILVEGAANVVSAEGNEVLAMLQVGDYFGEVSVLFDVPCTARVRTSTQCNLMMLDTATAKKMFHKVNVDIIDWFVAKRYLPTSDDLDRDRIHRRMLFKNLRQVPLLAEWTDEALKSLILQITPALTLFPPNSVIAMCDDPPVTLNIIIRGRAAMQDRTDNILVDVEVSDCPVVIGEASLLLGVHSEVTVQSVTCCEVIAVREDWLYNIVSKYPHEAGIAWHSTQKKWSDLVDTSNPLYKLYPSHLQFEVIFQMLKNSEVFHKCSAQCVYEICLHGTPEEYLPNELVCTQDEYDRHTFVLVLMGECELLTDPDMPLEITFSDGQVFCRSDWMKSSGELLACSQCIVLKMDYDEVNRATTTCTKSTITYPSQSQYSL